MYVYTYIYVYTRIYIYCTYTPTYAYQHIYAYVWSPFFRSWAGGSVLLLADVYRHKIKYVYICIYEYVYR